MNAAEIARAATATLVAELVIASAERGDDVAVEILHHYAENPWGDPPLDGLPRSVQVELVAGWIWH